MRICFVNPHTIIGKTLFSELFHFPHYLKYDFFLHLFKDPYNAVIIVDGTASALTGGSDLFKWISDNYFIMRIITTIEIYIWCVLNKVNPFKVPILFRKKDLNEKNDILFGFGFLSDTFKNQNLHKKSVFNSFSGVKILHASHYFSRTMELSKMIKETNTWIMAGESDLRHSAFFKKYFSFIKEFLIIPFVLRPRYKNIFPFAKRINKAVVLGIVSSVGKNDVGNKDYIDFFHTDTLHKMRRMLYAHKKDLVNEIDVKLHKDEDLPEQSKRLSNFFNKIKRIFKTPALNPYLKYDIVNEYNRYKMAIVPEENSGIPSVNFIEAMACGCAYVGFRDPMYRDYGMIEGVHFIAYDGDLDDLKAKISYYQLHPKELQIIAKNGERFVKDHFSEKKVLEDFIKDLNQLQTIHHGN